MREIADRCAYKPGIYIVQMGHLPFVKIGKSSSDLRGRIREIQLGVPLPLRILLAWPDATVSEAFLHLKMSPWRSRGEWYAVSRGFFPALQRLIKLKVKRPSARVTTADLRTLRQFHDHARPVIRSFEQQMQVLRDRVRFLEPPTDEEIAWRALREEETRVRVKEMGALLAQRGVRKPKSRKKVP